MDKPIDIRPERNVLVSLQCYFLEFCIECGGLHHYLKYKNWEKKYHVPLCYRDPMPGVGDDQPDLF